MSKTTQLVEIPIVGMQRETGGDSGGFSYAEGLTQTAQNEWQPIGSLVEGDENGFGLNTYSTTIPTTEIQSPDLGLFENRNQIYAINPDKLYSPSSDLRTIKDPVTPSELSVNNASSVRSYQLPIETITLNTYNFSSTNSPVTFSNVLDCFIGYQNSTYEDSYGKLIDFTGLVFFSKFTGKKLNDQFVDFPLRSFPEFDRNKLINTNKVFITESSSGEIGVIGLAPITAPPIYVEEHFVQISEEGIPDKGKCFKASSTSSSPGYVSPYAADMLAYGSFESDDGSGAIIDIIAVIGLPPNPPLIDITTRKDRVTVTNTFCASGAGVGGLGSNDHILISDFSMFSWV